MRLMLASWLSLNKMVLTTYPQQARALKKPVKAILYDRVFIVEADACKILKVEANFANELKNRSKRQNRQALR